MADGTCQICKRVRPLDDGRHVAAHPRYPTSVSATMQCQGSGKLCTEAQQANAETNRRRALARLERMRPDAEVAHDALAEGRPFPAHQLIRLIQAGLQLYRLEHADAENGARMARGRRVVIRPWFRQFRSQNKRRWRRRRDDEPCDIYCTFCRELLLSKVSRQLSPENRTAAHTNICALRCLARIAEPVPPEERRLPADVRPDGATT